MKLRSRTVDILTLPAPPAAARRARAEQVAIKALGTPDEERERYVMNLKRRVAEGTYRPSGMEIAEAMFAERIADNTVL